jgi:predicted MFS family arabinose efflux permease
MKWTQTEGYRTFSCMLAMLIGVGLVRYAYSPLIPSMLGQHWITAGQAGYLGTVNFVGNLAGALLCAPLVRRFSATGVCRVSLVIGLLSVTASAWDLGFFWLILTRLLAGLAAAGAMIPGPAIAVAGAPSESRGRILGLVFAGAGVGVIGLSLLLPVVLEGGPTSGWLFTGALVAVFLAIGWVGLREAPAVSAEQAPDAAIEPDRLHLWILAAAYSLVAIGIVPHSIYLSAYVHQALHLPTSFSAMVFAVYGVGVLVGAPLLDGVLAKRLGTWESLVLSSALGLGAVAVVLLTENIIWVVASGAALGAAQMGVASITSHRVIELAGPVAHTRWWSLMTIGFNVGQAGGALAMGAFLSTHWGYPAGFWMAGVALALATTLAFFVRRSDPSPFAGAHHKIS